MLGWVAATKLDFGSAGAAPPPLAPAEALQAELLRQNVGKSGDATLNRMYQEISERHFESKLPPLQVIWEPRLADVGPLAARAFTLHGMYGRIGRRAVILINSALQGNPAELSRTLSHEAVHAHLAATGDRGPVHGPLFQRVLERLASERAFEGVVATDEDRASLYAWLQAESLRLDAEHAEMAQLAADLRREHWELERTLGGTRAARNARRESYNQRAALANERADRIRASVEYFNRQVEQYNLMLVYPDGLDDRAMLSPRK